MQWHQSVFLPGRTEVEQKERVLFWRIIVELVDCLGLLRVFYDGVADGNLSDLDAEADVRGTSKSVYSYRHSWSVGTVRNDFAQYYYSVRNRDFWVGNLA